ncbi:MAG: flagellin [SAR324 cluster bacterium]|nr:flagellin [SAR324 cluster bacterium]
MTINSVRSSFASLNGHHSLLEHNRNLNKVFAQSASGLALVTPADDVAKFTFSEQLRTKISDATQADKNTANAISMVQTAESGLGQISSLLVNMRQVLIRAANEGASDEFTKMANQTEIDNSVTQLDLILANLQFGKKFLYKKDSGASGLTDSQHIDFIKANEKTASSGIDGYKIELIELPTRSHVRLLREINDEELELGNLKLTFIKDARKIEYITKPEQEQKEMLRALNRFFIRENFDVYATIDSKDRINFYHKNFGAKHSFQVASNADGLLISSSEEKEVMVVSDLGKDVKGTIGGEMFTGRGLDIYGKKSGRTEGMQLRLKMPNEILASTLFDDKGNPFNPSANFGLFNEKPDEVGKVHIDNRSLSYHIGSEYQQTVQFSIPEINSETLGQKVINDSDISNLRGVNVSDFNSSQDSLLIVDDALNEINRLRGKIGSFQKNLLEPSQITLADKLDKYVSAESQIRDADIAKSTAEMVKYELSQSVAIDVLKGANQRESEILRLFRN